MSNTIVFTNPTLFQTYGLTTQILEQGHLRLVPQSKAWVTDDGHTVHGWMLCMKVDEKEFIFALSAGLTGELSDKRLYPGYKDGKVFVWNDRTWKGPDVGLPYLQDAMKMVADRLIKANYFGWYDVITPLTPGVGKTSFGYLREMLGKKRNEPPSFNTGIAETPAALGEKIDTAMVALSKVSEKTPYLKDVMHVLTWLRDHVLDFGPMGFKTADQTVNQLLSSWMKKGDTTAWASILGDRGYPITMVGTPEERSKVFIESLEQNRVAGHFWQAKKWKTRTKGGPRKAALAKKVRRKVGGPFDKEPVSEYETDEGGSEAVHGTHGRLGLPKLTVIPPGELPVPDEDVSTAYTPVQAYKPATPVVAPTPPKVELSDMVAAASGAVKRTSAAVAKAAEKTGAATVNAAKTVKAEVESAAATVHEAVGKALDNAGKWVIDACGKFWRPNEGSEPGWRIRLRNFLFRVGPLSKEACNMYTRNRPASAGAYGLSVVRNTMVSVAIVPWTAYSFVSSSVSDVRNAWSGFVYHDEDDEEPRWLCGVEAVASVVIGVPVNLVIGVLAGVAQIGVVTAMSCINLADLVKGVPLGE